MNGADPVYVSIQASNLEESQDYGHAVGSVRPKEEGVESTAESDGDGEATEARRESADELFHRTTRLARDHGFDGFDSEERRTLPTRVVFR